MLQHQLTVPRGALAQPPERRRQIRQLALLRVALLHSGGSSDICVVKNVSPNGLAARVYRKLRPGAAVEIEFRSGEPLAGSVVWEDDHDVGIVFAEPIDVSAILASRWPANAGRRRALPRILVECRGLLDTGLWSSEVLLRDISQGGASLDSQTETIPSGKVRLLLPDLRPIAGVVRWTSATKVGVSFNECLPFEQLAQWIQARREGLGLAKVPERGAPDRSAGGRSWPRREARRTFE